MESHYILFTDKFLVAARRRSVIGAGAASDSGLVQEFAPGADVVNFGVALRH
jgi:hypothetical protein